MPFQVITSAEIEVGEPVTKELWTKTKNSLDDLDERLGNVEVGLQRIEVFNEQLLNASSASTVTGIFTFVATQDFTMVGSKLVIPNPSALSGTFEFDIKKLTNPTLGTFTSIFTTKPSITFPTTTYYQESTNAVFDIALKEILSGEVLKLDITQLPTGGPILASNYIVWGEV